MDQSSSAGDLLFSRRQWVLDSFLVAAPWLWLASLWICRTYLAPERGHSGTIGRPCVWDGLRYPFTFFACWGIALFLCLRILLCRRNVILRIAAILSYVVLMCMSGPSVE